MTERLCAPEPGATLLDREIDGAAWLVADAGGFAELVIGGDGETRGLGYSLDASEATALGNALLAFASRHSLRGSVEHERATACPCNSTP